MKWLNIDSEEQIINLHYVRALEKIIENEGGNRFRLRILGDDVDITLYYKNEDLLTARYQELVDFLQDPNQGCFELRKDT